MGLSFKKKAPADALADEEKVESDTAVKAVTDGKNGGSHDSGSGNDHGIYQLLLSCCWKNTQRQNVQHLLRRTNNFTPFAGASTACRCVY
jgi:hypothetical protein